MSKKLMLLALAAVSAVLFALPAVASAGQWTLTGGHQLFTGTSVGKTTLTTVENETVTCETASGNGTVNAAGNGGTISLVFHSCKEDTAGTICTTPGQPSGTIVASGNWASVYLTHTKTKPGIKIEGPGATKQLAEFKCGFGLITIKVEGSVVGEVEEPCGTEGTTFNIEFHSPTHGNQTFTQNTATGTETFLTAYRNNVPRKASQDGTGRLHLENKATLHCA